MKPYLKNHVHRNHQYKVPGIIEKNDQKLI